LIEENRLLRVAPEKHKHQLTEYEKLIRLSEDAERLGKFQRSELSCEKSKFQIDFLRKPNWIASRSRPG